VYGSSSGVLARLRVVATSSDCQLLSATPQSLQQHGGLEFMR
jgi:hypothetical protein